MSDLKLNIIMQAADKISAPFKGIAGSTQKLKTELATAASKVRTLEQTAKDMAAFKRLKLESRDNARAMTEAQAKADTLAAALATTEGKTTANRKAFAAAKAELKRLKAAQSAAGSETKILRDRLAAAGVNTKQFGAAQKRLTADLDAARKAAEKQAAALGRLKTRTDAVAKARAKMQRTTETAGRMGMAGATGMATGGAALYGMAGMASAGIDFGAQMSAVGAVARVDKTSEAFAQLKAQAEELGATTKFSASEAAQGMQYLAMAGFDAQKIMQTMPGVLDLAAASGADLGTTSDIASNILSGFGLQADQMGRVGDVLTATFTRSNVDLAMLGETMKYVGPVAAELGTSIEDASAMAGLLGNVGIQGGMAGTALRALFNRMSAPPAEAEKSLKALGIATADAEGNMRPMTAILTDMAAATEGMGSVERNAHFVAIAGQEAGTALSKLVGESGVGAITKFSDVLKNSGGEASRVAKAMSDNASGDLKGLASAFEGLNIALTDTNDAPLRDLIQSVTGVVRGLRDWVKENPALAGTIVKVAAGIAGLVFVGGALMTAVAGILGPFAMMRFALTGVGAALPMVATGIKAIGTALMSNPIGLIIGGIALAATLIYAYWEPISEFFAGLWDGIGSIFDMGIGDIVDKIKFFLAPIGWIGSAIGKLFGDDTPDDAPDDAAAPSPRKPPTKPGGPSVPPSAPALPTVKHTPITAKSSGSGTAVHMGGITIHVHAAPGMDVAAIAREVKRQLAELANTQARNQRGALYDGV